MAFNAAQQQVQGIPGASGAPPASSGGLLGNLANFAATNAAKKPQAAQAQPQTLLGSVSDNATKTLLGS